MAQYKKKNPDRKFGDQELQVPRSAWGRYNQDGADERKDHEGVLTESEESPRIKTQWRKHYQGHKRMGCISS